MEKVLEFVAKEKEILDFWQKNNIFEKSVAQRPEENSYVFYDGPPFATGLPHYGHIIASLNKDVVPRYWTMRGFRAERRWGWDCHGLPVENLVEQELHLQNRKDIERIGVEKFNQACRAIVLRYVDEWKKVIPRIGRWVDMENAYKTMDFNYMESIWWAFQQLWQKGLIYQDYKSMHICPRCGTTLSNFEVTQGYQDVEDLSVTVKCKLKGKEGFILAWTTTPWTLPGNVALAVGEDIDYVKVRAGDQFYFLAKERLEMIPGDYEIVEEMKGKDLVGWEYEPLFDYFVEQKDLENRENGWKIYGADFVSTAEGTGAVHIAPAFGEDDLKLGYAKKLPFVQHVDENGCFTEEVREWAGEEVKPKGDISRTDRQVVEWLEQKGKIFSQQKITHSYPFCWRCDTPLLNYATSSWFVKVTAIKDKIIKNNEKVNWVPRHIKHGRFGKWLEEARDWSVSRSRYWGTPLPIWQCQGPEGEGIGSCGHTHIFGSAAELEKTSGQEIHDFHRPYIDQVTFRCEKCGGVMKRVPEVFDCWFESGLMPYAQVHYPFENKESFERNFPAQFVAEGIDQTRGWFYTLMVLSTALFDQPAFLNNIVNGIILAEDGQKMSKRLKNYPEPMQIVDRYGADAMRFYLLTSAAVKADDLRFSEKGVEEVLKKVLIIFWNVHTFYKMYAAKNEKASATPIGRNNILDRWILSRLNSLNQKVRDNMDAYDLLPAVRALGEFINDLSTWYVRRSRDRFKDAAVRQEATAVLRSVLFKLSKIAAPFIPFFSEQIYQSLRAEDDPESVHLCDYPAVVAEWIDENLEESMKQVRAIASDALAARSSAGVKVRQPLSRLIIKDAACGRQKELLDLIKAEVNVKEVIVDENLKQAVEIDTEITPALKEEGLWRECFRQIQIIRQKARLSPVDQIAVSLQGPDSVLEVLKKYEQQMKEGLRMKKIIWGQPADFTEQSSFSTEEGTIDVRWQKS